MISKEILAQIILDFHKEELPQVLSRDLRVKLPFPLKRAAVILGPRRCGKTFYMYHLMNQLRGEGVAGERLLYINFEHPKFIGADLSDATRLIEVFYEIYPRKKKIKTFFFFDEPQNIPRWEAFTRYLLDKENAQIVLSGSSSKLLSKEIATALRGRTLNFFMYPFSFREYARFHHISFEKYLSSEQKAKISRLLKTYLQSGGYPEVLLYPEARERIVSEIVEVTILMDLIERHGIRNTKVVKLMFSYLSRAKEFSVHQFFNFLKSLNIKVSKNSLYNYLEYFQDAFIFFPLRKFSYSLKETEQSIPKMYAVDNALISIVTGKELGKRFENAVFLKLLQSGLVPNKDIFYYKGTGGQEVDFVVKKEGKVNALIQSCADLTDFRTKEREMRSLLKASIDLSCNRLVVITGEDEKEEKIDGRTIHFIPLGKWLMGAYFIRAGG